FRHGRVAHLPAARDGGRLHRRNRGGRIEHGRDGGQPPVKREKHPQHRAGDEQRADERTEPPTPSAQRNDVHVAHLVTKNRAVVWMRTGETYASMNAAPTRAMQQKASTSPVATTCCGRLMSRRPNSTRVADEERLSVAAPAATKAGTASKFCGSRAATARTTPCSNNPLT